MSNLIILVGNIGSGKTTLVKQLTKQGYIVISRDALRYMIGGGEYLFDVDLEPEIFKIERYALRVLSDFGHNIIIDETNMSLTIRGRHFDCIKDKGYQKIAIIMPKLSKEESISRRLASNHGCNDRQVWGDVWDRFDKVYSEPTKEEGFDKVIHYQEGKVLDQ